MTEDDKALVERLREEADEWDEPKSHDEFDMRGMLHSAADRIEALSAENERLTQRYNELGNAAMKQVAELGAKVGRLEAENERLREKLIGIRAEIDDMENPFNGDGNPEMRHGFEMAVDQAVNIITGALGEVE